MSKTYTEITPEIANWIGDQKIFFVATAPTAVTGHLNCSPKGLDSFRILDSHTVAYLDFTGSGAETIAHVRENRRIIVMFCAFSGPPQIVRLHGTGEIIHPQHPDWERLRSRFPVHAGARSIIRIEVTRISDSCGYAVPEYEFRGNRSTLTRWAESQGPEGIIAYQQRKNRRSIDGLPAVET